MAPISREVQELLNLSDEELLSRLGPGPGGSQSEQVHRILDLRHARSQASAADGLVNATKDLVGATRRLASATYTLVAVTAVLVLVAAVQAYVAVRPASQTAWVLWQERPVQSKQFALDHFTSGVFRVQQECDAVAEVKNQAETMPRDEAARRRLPQGRWLCLPDTVDPRGPKGN